MLINILKNFQCLVCDQVLKAVTAIASASDLPVELLLHFVAALPREFSDFGGMDFFDSSVRTLFFPGYRTSTSFTLNAYQMPMFDFFFNV